MNIFGNTQGLSQAQIKSLEQILRRRVPFSTLTTPELTRSLCEVAHTTHRQVGVLVNRQGVVEWVIAGDSQRLMLPDIGRLRGARGRLRGLRLIHVHLRNEPLSRDDLVDLTRLRLDLVAAICLSPEGRPLTVYYGHNLPLRPRQPGDPEDYRPPAYETQGPIPYRLLDFNPEEHIRGLEAEFARAAQQQETPAPEGRALLVHVAQKQRPPKSGPTASPNAIAQAPSVDVIMGELEELARTAGLDVADTIVQRRARMDPRYLLGRGKLEDVVIRAMQVDADVLIFNQNLSPTQSAVIAGFTDLKVIDRTQLILDIFAQHAQSTDGKLQVELAQMKYLLPRLGTRDDALSRLTGGIGGRGPGETKLEIGRRRAHERITRLEKQLKNQAKQRLQRRSLRQKHGVPILSIVGYTNAGKSTLLNALTQSDVIVENKLFATLDTRSRRLRFPREREVIITDTVGFIRDLPKDLFNAFRATFEEAQDANLLLHVVDASTDEIDDHMATTDDLIKELGLDAVPRLVVMNKSDQLTPEEIDILRQRYEGTIDHVFTSALDPQTLHPLLEKLESNLFPSAPDHDAVKATHERAELSHIENIAG